METSIDGQTSLWRQKLEEKIALEDQKDELMAKEKLESSILLGDIS